MQDVHQEPREAHANSKVYISPPPLDCKQRELFIRVACQKLSIVTPSAPLYRYDTIRLHKKLDDSKVMQPLPPSLDCARRCILQSQK